MKSELSFLLELVLDDEVPKPIKLKMVARIREVEKNYAQTVLPQPAVPRGTKPGIITPIIAAQSPSMQQLMAQNPDLIPKPPQPVTAEAAQALANRQAKILGAANEKPEPGRTSPRKF